MTREQELDMTRWAGGESVGHICSSTKIVYPDDAMKRWEVSNSDGCILANADNYYTKAQVEKRLKDYSGVTIQDVEDIVSGATSGKAETSYVDEIAAQVSANTQAILNTYTKQETNVLLESYLTKLKANEMFANYSKVEDTTLVLNSENITI